MVETSIKIQLISLFYVYENANFDDFEIVETALFFSVVSDVVFTSLSICKSIPYTYN